MIHQALTFFKLTFLRKQIFLYLALATLLLSVLLYLFRGSSPLSATEDKYLATVQTKTQEEIKASDDDLEKVKALVVQSADTSFVRLSILTKYPYYIFKNGHLIYWSDHQFVPDYQTISGNYNVNTFDWVEGKFIANRRVVPNQIGVIEIYSLINLYRQYESENNHLKSGYNYEIFSIDPQAILTSRSGASHYNINSENQTFLFSVKPPKVDALRNQSIPLNAIVLGLISMLFLVTYLTGWIYYFYKKGHFEMAFLILFSYLVLLRIIMIFYSIPLIFYDSDLFNPKFFTAPKFAPSLGDLILNLLGVIALLLFLVNTYFRSKIYFKLLHLSVGVRAFISIILVIISYFLFYGAYRQLIDIYDKSQYRLDLALSVNLFGQSLKMATLLTYVLISVVYFLTVHLLANLFIKTNRKIRTGIILWAIGTVIVGILFLLLSIGNVFILALNGLYFLILYVIRFPRFLYTFRYQTSIYFFTAALVCASLATYVLYHEAIGKDFRQKQLFGKKILAENDEIGEFLLSKMTAEVQKDSTIKSLLKTAILPREQIQNQIKKFHLDSHFDTYDVEIAVFDKNGLSLENTSGADGYKSLEAKYNSEKYKTQYSNLYFVNAPQEDYLKQYVDFIEVKEHNSNAIIGRIMVDLKQRRSDSQNVYNELSGSDLEATQPEETDYSYGVFENNAFTNTGGKGFNYERKMTKLSLAEEAIFTKGITENGFRHVAVKGQNGRTIIVSSPEITFSSIYSNFSFLFLVLVVTIIFIVLTYATRYGFSKMNVNLATKIQIFLNMAFLLPLILVVVITLSIIGTKLAESQNESFLNQTENVGISLAPALDRFVKGKMSRLYFESDTLKRIAFSSQKDISVFDTTGHLLVASKSLPYQTGVVSTYLNPKAFNVIVEEKENKKTFPEELGTLQFTTSYVGVKSGEGKLLGVVGVPFYDAKIKYDKEVIAVIGSMLNTFTSIFLVLLILSYFASNVLTVPLRLITNKLRKIDLEKPNEPLKWKSDDEIGVLIASYNQMLVKLDESKKALSESNMQTAWQEMAKQVAHEIKNPLTPMKLNLQMLQRRLNREGQTNPMVDDQLNSIIDQIDNLSYIANSFYAFAKMPVPKNERFDLVQVTSKIVNLYAQDAAISVKTEIKPKSAVVIGDPQLTGSIVSNLIINAVQSVPDGRKPSLEIGLIVGEGSATFSIKDNGSGIPKEIRNKVFLLNFSTKDGGSGVGLALAKRVIENANGSIWFDTVLAEGTTFLFSLPLA